MSKEKRRLQQMVDAQVEIKMLEAKEAEASASVLPEELDAVMEKLPI